ncbi:MAG: hypothetical protein ACI909_003897 [Planctomycetota bacterium]|jgi:hypothetical protein
MIFSKNNSSGGTNGIAALAILKILLGIMEKKQLLSKEEIDILLNCAEVEVDNTDIGGQVTEAKFLINNLMKVSDDTTRGYSGSTN